MQINVSKRALYSMIKKAVKDVIQEERIEYILKAIPAVSDKEMHEIRQQLGEKPPKRKAARRKTINV